MNDEKKSLGPSVEGNTDLEPTNSLDVGVVKNHGDLHRSFTPRQVHVSITDPGTKEARLH